MKKAIAVILVVLLLLSGITYAIGYGNTRIVSQGDTKSGNRWQRIAEMYLRKRDGPDLSILNFTWNSNGKRRLEQCRNEVSNWWMRILERIDGYDFQIDMVDKIT